MDAQQQLSALLELAESLGITVRPAPAGMESSDHAGGAMVRLKGKDVFFLGHAASLPEQVDALAAGLAGRAELEDRFVRPEVRALLDRVSQ